MSVVLEEDSEDSLRLLPTFGLGGIPHIVDDRTVFEQFGVTGHPAVVVQKPDGTFDRYGFIGPQDLQDRIGEVLAVA